MQTASHSDESGDLLVECLDVRLGDEQVRLGDREVELEVAAALRPEAFGGFAASVTYFLFVDEIA